MKLIVGLFASALAAANLDYLYTLQASPRAVERQGATALWIHRPGNYKLERRARLVPDGVSIYPVTYDEDARVIAIAYPFAEPKSIMVLRMDDPATRGLLAIGGGDLTSEESLGRFEGLLDIKERGLFYAFLQFRNHIFSGLFGLDLRSSSPVRHILDWSAMPNYRNSGAVTLDSYESPKSQLHVERGAFVFDQGDKPRYPLPSEFTKGTSEDTRAYIHVSNTKVFAVSHGEDGNGNTKLWIRSHATGAWTTINVVRPAARTCWWRSRAPNAMR